MLKEKINCVILAGDEQTMIGEVVAQFPRLKIDQVFSSPKKFQENKSKHICDIMIINADVLGGDLSFLSQVKYNNAQIIILSANQKLAEEGYNYQIAHFISLPLTEEKLFNALNKTEEKVLQLKKDEIYKPLHHQFLFIRAEYKLMKINFSDILYIEGLKDYSKIYTTLAANKAIITLQNLKSFEEKLSAEDFIRVHRSYIVSLSKIEIIHKNSILIGKTEIPVSDGFRNHLHSIISKYL